MEEDDKQTVLDFMKSNKLATLSTINTDSGRPQSALIAFVELPSLELVFQTFDSSRKYQNLLKNPAVSFVVGWNLENWITLQYEGTATALTVEEAKKYHPAFLAKDSPSGEFFLNHPKARFFKVMPTWLRYADYSCGHPQFIEHDFTANGQSQTT